MENTITVIIREIREKTVVVDTNSVEDALDTVEYLYGEGNFILTNDDFEDVEFIVEENKEKEND
jgi:hypothetical protein